MMMMMMMMMMLMMPCTQFVCENYICVNMTFAEFLVEHVICDNLFGSAKQRTFATLHVQQIASFKSHNGHLRSLKSHNGHLRVSSLTTDICGVFSFPTSQRLQLPDATFSNISVLATPRCCVFQHSSACSSQIVRFPTSQHLQLPDTTQTVCGMCIVLICAFQM